MCDSQEFELMIEELFDIQHNILQAPMAGASTPELAAAVSNSGGLGAIGAAPMTADVFRTEIHRIRTLTDKLFNVNLFAAASEEYDRNALPGEQAVELLKSYHEEVGLAELPLAKPLFGPVDEQLAIALEEKTPVISFHFGVEAHQIQAIHAVGLKVICSATTVEEAIELEALGVDAVIAQGAEAGGHRGTFIGDYRAALIGTLALVPQVVDAVSVPVIAAGGIMDGRGIVACEALGASAVQLGTAFLGCPESGIPNLWREQLKLSSPSRTTVTEVISGKPARGLRNRYVDEMEALEEELLPYPLQYSISRALREKAIADGNPDFPTMWSGQGVGLLREMSAETLIQTLVDEAKVQRNRLSR